MSKELAQAAKARGNEAFVKGDYQTAVEAFTEAIEQDPTDHVFFSNRSGAFASLGDNEKALEDAEACLKLKPSFVKGYSRKGKALFELRRLQEAEKAYQQGLELDGANAALLEGLEETKKAISSPPPSANPLGALFGPQMFVKLQSDPTTREYLKDPSFVAKLNELQRNPSNMTALLSDPRISTAFSVLLGLPADAMKAGKEGDEDSFPSSFPSPSEAKRTSSGVEVSDVDSDEEEEERPQPKASSSSSFPSSSSSSYTPPPRPSPVPQPAKKAPSAAEKLKEEGNALYLKKSFAEAIEKYNEAISLEPDNILFLNNLAAVFLEQKDFDKALETCEKALSIAAEKGASFKDVAKVLFRKGNIFLAQGKYEEAIEAYNKSQVEDRSDKTKAALKKAEQLKKAADEKAYLNPELSEAHKAKGNELFQQGKWVEAIAEYSEALRRNPDNYKVLSNRAACYTKLMDWGRGLEDCDKCLSVDPKFVKAYIRKGKIQHFLKQYHKALETYNKGLEIDPTASELLEAKRATVQAINSGKADPERAKMAMQDPEIQAIVKDPVINKVLSEMENNPQAAMKAMADPEIKAKIEKLIAAGVLQVQ